MRQLALSLLLTLPLLLSGCLSSGTPDALRTVPIPLGGGNLTASIWEAVNDPEVDPEATEFTKERSSFWLIPFNLESNSLTFYRHSDPTRPNTAVGEMTSHNDLLGPLFLTTLPLRTVRTEYRYREGEEKPVSRRGFGWTPFWAWSWQKGEPINDGIEYSAAGVPLIYGQLKFKTTADMPFIDDYKEVAVSLRNTLWTLGPAVANFRVSDADGDYIKGWYATPLFLGGILGMTLWSDYVLTGTEDRKEGRFSSVAAHGPLFGTLGALQIKSSYSKDMSLERKLRLPRETRRLLLGGILWTDVVDRNTEGKKWDASHGPLWGMVGWGAKDGRFALRLFWVPITF